MRRRLRRPAGDLALAIITIFAIAGTLSACGRYGSPVRVAPVADSTAQTRTLEEETASPGTEPSAKAAPVEEENE